MDIKRSDVYMRFPTASEMIDENTVAYYSFDGNANDVCGNYHLEGTGVYTKVGNYEGGGDVYAAHSRGRFKNNSLKLYINSHVCTIDFAFRANNANGSGINGDSLYYLLFLKSSTDSTSFKISYNKSYLSVVNSMNTNNSSEYALRIPLSEFYQNGFHHLVMIKNKNIYTFYFDGRYVGSKTDSIGWSFSNSNFYIGYANESQLDILYLRLSNGIRYSQEFIKKTPIDDIIYFYSVKEKDNEIYGLKTNNGGE